MMKPLSNQYFVYIKADQEPIPWNIYDVNPPSNLGLSTYYSRVFQAMEKHLKVSGLVFYVTWDEINELPSYGENVIAVVLGDEWFRIPKYFHKVGAVFKCLGTRPILGCNPLLQPSYLNFLSVIQFLRILVYRLPWVINYHFQKFKLWQTGRTEIPPIYDIPQGYGNSKDLPIKDIEARPNDVFFAGSVVHVPLPPWSLKQWLGTPKTFSRREMISSLNNFMEKHPEMKADLSVTPGFHATSQEDVSTYSERMMNAKICLIPRGTSFETIRFFEAIRYGCIPVTELLPSRWFYEEAPAIQIKNWRELGEVLENLLENKHLLQEKHQESLKWWETKCSEAVVGQYMAERLNSLKSAS
ncbi:exostosin family protein [Nostocales cyanobacterium HT-58-2]|nr:exostosin family protein [Nostocales cyanobacterium HT-58-2]